MALAGFFPGQIRFLSSVFALAGTSAMVAYYHFVLAFTHNPSRLGVKVGYGVVALIFAPLAFLGYFPQSAQLVSGGLDINYGAFMYLLSGTAAVFLALSVSLLVRRFRTLRDPEERGRVAYLLAAIILFMLFGFREAVPPTPKFPLAQVGLLCNALVIAYTIMKYQLLDIKLVIKRGLVYSVVTVFVTAAYLLILSFIYNLVGSWFSMLGIGAIIGSAVIMAWLFNPLKTAAQKGVDKLFYGKSYDYRQMVLSFTQRMGNVLELSELAGAMLQPITKAVHAAQASLLLDDGHNFHAQFAERQNSGEPVIPIKLRAHSLIVTWLAEKNQPLSRAQIDLIPELKGVWQTDIDKLDAAEVELLFPMRSRGNLIGILTVSKKKPAGIYSRDDMELLNTLAHEAAVIIENAQLYAEARQRANVDELTGLFNQRYLHQRLDEEIARCLRFGDIFTLLFLDLDLFKSYNDIYGHLEGDKILQQAGKIISSAVRSIDIRFRYGGDEFAVILPRTPVDGTRNVAERILREIEARMDTRGIPLTCSIGIASWPTDGLRQEELIRAADAALYYAKRTGRNRVCLASEVAFSEAVAIQAGSENKKAILNTIYALAATVDAKDHYTYGHSKKVSKYATDIAAALGYPKEKIDVLRTAGLLHDIGKIGVSDEILRKLEPLSSEEWKPIYAHPDLGVSILKHVEGLRDCLAGVQYHHERYDGSGYPEGLKGENIPLDARILAVCDAYDALTSERPYHKRFTRERALEELKRCAGTQFDPRIVKIFVRLQGFVSQKDKVPSAV
jgi:diguanylate cyclase (GGDEF)-like protein/putative nucleotidyltransferase with HDIG domain